MEAQVKTPLERKIALEALVKSTGWGLLVNIAKEQVRFREQKVLLTPLTSSSGVYAQEFEKGEAAGLRLLLKLPHSLLDSIQQELNEKEPQDDD